MYNRTLSVESHTHSVCFCQNGGKPPHNFCTAYNGRRYLLKCSESGAAREWVHSYEVCCIPTIPSDQNGNFVGSIAMKRVPACMFAVVSTVSMGFKSIRIHECVFLFRWIQFHLDFDFDCMHDAMLAKATGNLLHELKLWSTSTKWHPYVFGVLQWQHPFHSSMIHSKWQPRKSQRKLRNWKIQNAFCENQWSWHNII